MVADLGFVAGDLLDSLSTSLFNLAAVISVLTPKAAISYGHSSTLPTWVLPYPAIGESSTHRPPSRRLNDSDWAPIPPADDVPPFDNGMPLHSEDLARMPLYPEYSSADAWPQNGLQAPFSADVYPSSETNFTSSGSFNQGYGDTTSFVGLPFLPPQDPVAHPQHEPGYPGHTNSSKFYGQDSSLTSYGRMLRMGSSERNHYLFEHTSHILP